MKLKNHLFVIIILIVTISCNKSEREENFDKENTMTELKENSSLKADLEERKENFSQKADAYVKKIYKEGIDDVRASGITDNAKQIGDIAPNFTLTNAVGKSVELKKQLEQGPVVLTWYRGGWCPYCNLTLRSLQQELPNFKAEGASLFALTPEIPDSTLNTSEKNDLDFEVLSDIGNKIAREYGIVFTLTEEVAARYNDSFNLNENNGDDSNELPLAATYVIGQSGEIVYAFLDADYRNRAEPSEITEFLKGLNQ